MVNLLKLKINEDEFSLSKGNQQEDPLKNSGLLAQNPQYTDKDGNSISEQEAIFTVKDKDGNINTIQKEGVMATLKDGTKALLSSVVEMTENVAEVTKEFVDGYMNQANKLFTTGDGIASLISDVNAGLQKGEEPEQIARTIATKLAIKQIFEQGSEVIKQQIQENLMDNAADIAALESGNYLELSVDAIESLQKLESITSHPAFTMGYSVAVSLATTIILSHDEGWNSEEYTQAAINATAQVAAQYAVSSYFAAGSAGAAGVGAGVAHLISAGVNDLFADDHMNSHQWQSTVNTAGVMMAAAYAGSALGSAIAAGSLLGPIGAYCCRNNSYPIPRRQRI